MCVFGESGIIKRGMAAEKFFAKQAFLHLRDLYLEQERTGVNC